jgi:hypothetical protein
MMTLEFSTDGRTITLRKTKPTRKPLGDGLAFRTGRPREPVRSGRFRPGWLGGIADGAVLR